MGTLIDSFLVKRLLPSEFKSCEPSYSDPCSDELFLVIFEYEDEENDELEYWKTERVCSNCCELLGIERIQFEG
jgi:hypothetical protein